MSDNNEIKEFDEMEDPIFTLTDEETGEEKDFALIARAELDIRAIAASAFTLPFSVILRSKYAAKTTTGIATYKGAEKLSTAAMESAPKPT